MPSHVPTDVTAEFYIDGEWTDTYAGVDLAARVRGDGTGIRLTTGLVDQQSATSPISATLTLNNADNLFTNDHPDSPLFGKLPLNSQVRVGVQSGGLWDAYLLTPDFNTGNGQRAETADKASLDITGDIDVRMELTPHYTRNAQEQLLMGKYIISGNQRSWAMTLMPDGSVHFINSTTGSDVNVTLGSAVMVPEESKRCAIRVTVDVNDGAGNRVFRFYTSDSFTIAGPWTQVSSGTFAGTTSIFSSTAPLEIGAANVGGHVFSGAMPYAGKIHAAEVYSGIAGTLVADFKPDTRAPEDTTWADTCASPNTWTLEGAYIRLASDRIRVCGEMTSIPDDWDETGRDVFTPVTLAGIFQRYSGNKSALGSAIYRYRRNQDDIAGYWPCETSGYTPIPFANEAVLVSCTFGTATGLDGSDGALTLTDAGVSSAKFVSFASGVTGENTFVFYFNLTAAPASETTFCTVYASTGATATRWEVLISSTTYRFSAFDADGVSLSSQASTHGAGASPVDQWIAMSVSLETSGANVLWRNSWHAVGSETFYTTSGVGHTFAGSVGRMYTMTFSTGAAEFAGAQIAHPMFGPADFSIVDTTVANVSKGWADETAGRRGLRLSGEENFAFEWRGDLDDTPAMGPQSSDTLFANLTAVQNVDGGILGESRDRLGAKYVTRKFLGNRTKLTLEYGESRLSEVPRPTGDNRYTVNDFTANRPGGTSARSEVTDPLLKNTSDPPAGAGRWERTGSFNVAADSQVAAMAQKQTQVGSWPERRVPNLAIGLHRSEIFSDSLLMDAVIQTDFGDPVLLTDLIGSPVPPFDLLTTVVGYTETFDGFLWTITANTVPAGPFQVPILADYIDEKVPTLDATDSSHSVIKAALTTTATSFTLKTDASGTYPTTRWVDATNYPNDIGGGTTLDVIIGGEVITLSTIGTPTLVSGFNEQVATVSARSVNGIVKAHDAGSPVFVFDKYYLGEL